jgi:hypothetical protein
MFLLLLAQVAIAQDPDPCNCKSTDPTLQYRTLTKHRKSFSHYAKASAVITPQTIMGWQQTYNQRTANINRSNESKRLRKMKGTPEDTLYTLKGYIYYITIQEDCDYHIEIGTDDPNAPRAVVELPNDKCSVQQKLLNQLRARGITIKSFKLKREFPDGIPCMVKGLGFYDGWHAPDDHGRPQTHGSSWELHPVVSIELDVQ